MASWELETKEKCFVWKGEENHPNYYIISVADRSWGDKTKRPNIYIKTPNPKCSLYWCLIEFID
jgi:hypothetical protein